MGCSGKLLTGFLSDRLTKWIDDYTILNEFQVWHKKNSLLPAL